MGLATLRRGRAAGPHAELRYERLAAHPGETSRILAQAVTTPAAPIRDALRYAHDSSVGRWRRDLTRDQLGDVEREAGPLLRELGYL